MPAYSTLSKTKLSPLERRQFLKLGISSAAGLAIGLPLSLTASPNYSVGVGNSTDPYEATIRAVNSSFGWPGNELNNKKVIIKPNLVLPTTAETGAVTDPQVVRALTDLALQDGASEVYIVENENGFNTFSACGYDFFRNYHQHVSLVSLEQEAISLQNVPNALTYSKMYIPNILLGDDVFFISAAKMKTHSCSYATLSMKNLFGIAPVHKYSIASQPLRWGMHLRGVCQVIVDLNLVRAVDFAVVDGVWAMEGDGPTRGTPVPMNIVVAGSNAVAVDRVCLDAMSIPQAALLSLHYASSLGMGPATPEEIDIFGDSYNPFPFKWPSTVVPLLEIPYAQPQKFSANGFESVQITSEHHALPCYRRIDIIKVSNLNTNIEHIRNIEPWKRFLPEQSISYWDGRDDNGALVSQGVYCIWLRAQYGLFATQTYATGWVVVV